MVVDFGVWSGRNLPSLIGIGSHVAATETPDSYRLLAETAERFPEVEFFGMPLTELSFGKKTVGAALCWRVLHNLTHSTECIQALRELHRVLALNAPLLVAVRLDLYAKKGESDENCYIRRLPNGTNGWRDAVYFNTTNFRKIAHAFGFGIDVLTQTTEDEWINSELVTNTYLVAHLIKTGVPNEAEVRAIERLFVKTSV